MTEWEQKTMDHAKQTLAFYDRNTDAFVAGSRDVDLREIQTRFLACLSPHALILDFGCGSGRDTKAFLETGYRVEAVDGSEKICAAASEYTGIPVRKMLLQELAERERYDGIWASASLLHLTKGELPEVLGRIERAMKPGGVMYASFKYGEFEGLRDGRHYTDFTEETLKAFWEKEEVTMEIMDLWVTEDALPERRTQKWVNVLARRRQE